MAKKFSKLKINKIRSISRLKTGVPGLDRIIEGGIPEQSVVLLSGTCGTGKTILGFQFLLEGAKNGEPGVYVALEEDPVQIISELERFHWPISKLIDSKKLLVIRPDLYKYDSFITTVEDAVKSIGAKRLVIDSISVISLYFEELYKVRKAIYDLSRTVKDWGTTSLLITEVKEGTNEISTFGVEEYVADGVIVLGYNRNKNTFSRSLNVRKMRYINHFVNIFPMRITPNGIVISSA